MSRSDPTTAASSNGWGRTLAGVCIAQATAIAGFDFTLPFIPLYLQNDLGVHGLAQTALWSGLIGFGPAIPATIFGPMWGRLSDRFGYRTMLLRAMICAALLLALMGLAPSPGILLVLRMIQGGLTGTVFAAQALVATSVPEGETARSMSLLQMSVYVGATIGPVGGGLVAETFGYRAAFLSAGILLGSAALVVLAWVREPARRDRSIPHSPEPRPSTRALLTIPAFAGALVLTLIVQLASTSLFPVIPLYVQDLLHGGRAVAADTGWLFALSGLAGATGSYIAGRMQRHVSLQPMLIGAVVMSAALLAPQAWAGNFLVFLAMRTVAAFAFGALFSVVGTLTATSSPRNAKGAAFGLAGAASSLGFGGGPMLGGALVAAVGIRPLFVLAAGLLIVVPGLLLGIMTVLPSLLGRLRIAPGLETRLRAARSR